MHCHPPLFNPVVPDHTAKKVKAFSIRLTIQLSGRRLEEVDNQGVDGLTDRELAPVEYLRVLGGYVKEDGVRASVDLDCLLEQNHKMKRLAQQFAYPTTGWVGGLRRV